MRCSLNAGSRFCQTKYFEKLQKQYPANPKSGLWPFFKPGDTFLLKHIPQDDFCHLMNGSFCGKARDALSRYVYNSTPGRIDYERLSER